MTTLTLTSKRQATFPKETCEALGLKPGDVIALEARNEGGSTVWVLRPQPARTREWVGCLGSQARKVKSHSLAVIRESIAAGRKGGVMVTFEKAANKLKSVRVL
jgi:bifunctional DNA-binding transcriptional regulator/antitoxin component of YhaV-PrlF toxin-antitoxin module